MKIESGDQLGLILKNLLDKHSLSMRKLSERTDIDTATISRIISGKRRPTLEHLHLFSKHLDIPMNELLEAAGYPLEQEANDQSELNQYVNEIQNSLDSSVASGFSIENIDRKLKEYANYAQTEDGKEAISSGFDEKIKKVDSVGPFINFLKDFFKKFQLQNGSSKELILIGSALLYFIIPVDVIPDYIFPIGFIDDAIAVQVISKKIAER
ncbi:transcriptional regulator [Bacillus sp. J14TS2]|uniref:helix-turn-helix domain-containing protein n=1 Tax=Bacillus sp. J14TS2 TaxID=2807188 RepID=UPI001B015715|nr:helix-turn-helix domain-containing protein [Bacillus sp. J14TS2]GIN73011.1 transcriptional regulator [Bacillus sp. J14TS2]